MDAMLPYTLSKSKPSLRSTAGTPAARRAPTRGQRTLLLLAGLWLLGGVDLSMTTLARQHDLLDAGSEYNPLAARVLPFGSPALLTYKILLTAGGSLGLVLYRGRRIAELASVLVLIVYALVAIQWMLFCTICAPLRDISLNLGDFCHAAKWVGGGMVGCVVTICLAAWAHTRQRQRHQDRRFGWKRRRACGARTASVWETHGPLSFGLRTAAALAVCTSLFSLCCSPARSEQHRTEGTVSGTIYFRKVFDSDGRLWSMNAVGSNKSLLPRGVRGEPSRRLHGSHRWFLDIRDIPGQAYPDGGQRRELFAVRSDGLSLQLSDQPDLEPSPLTPRWPIHMEDRAISWVARRWDNTGQVVEGGIYFASVALHDNGQVLGLVAQPRAPVVRLELALVQDFDPWWRTRAPDIRGHDWSPDGTTIVYNSMTSELFIADMSTGRTTRVTDVPACSPVWSPDGKQIAFKIYRPFGEIATIRPDGSHLKIVTVRSSGEYISVTTPTWSPTGGHLAYRRLSHQEPVELPPDADVFVAAADGHGPVNLTADVDTLLIPVAWR
jgi:hypothetical protein